MDNPRVHPEIITPEFDLFYWDFKQWIKITIDDLSIEKSALKEKITLNFEPKAAVKFKLLPKSDLSAVYMNEVRVFDSNSSLITNLNWFIGGQKIPENPIIPAQQTFVMKLQSEKGEAFIWMGDLWGSASDNRKGHDYQYWSKPLEFNNDGTIRPLKWEDSWKF